MRKILSQITLWGYSYLLLCFAGPQIMCPLNQAVQWIKSKVVLGISLLNHSESIYALLLITHNSGLFFNRLAVLSTRRKNIVLWARKPISIFRNRYIYYWNSDAKIWNQAFWTVIWQYCWLLDAFLS